MKTIRRRIPARTNVSYQCWVCGTKYRSKKSAQKCEARTLEIREFSEGYWVRAKEKRHCGLTGKSYICEGIIVDVLGPMLPDEEYENKWLGGKTERLNGHVYQYEVQFICPCCNKLKRAFYYGPGLQSLEVVKKSGPWSGPEKRHQTR